MQPSPAQDGGLVEFTLRDAELSDADALGEVHMAAWRQTYHPHILSQASLDAATPAESARRWRETLQTKSTRRIVVALAGGSIVGFASAGNSRDSDASDRRELFALYLLASAHGSGAGQAMFDAILADAPAIVWVAENNPRAQAFYRRNGFIADGQHKVAPFVLDEVAEIRMTRG
jgi:RimJ/RimL family protein N-acetyltransferase